LAVIWTRLSRRFARTHDARTLYAVDAKQSDQHQLEPLVDAVEANMSLKPEQVAAAPARYRATLRRGHSGNRPHRKPDDVDGLASTASKRQERGSRKAPQKKETVHGEVYQSQS
jgi:hypothetical protein